MSDMGDVAVLTAAQNRRRAAWDRVNGNIAALRTGLAERPLTQRLKDDAADRAISAAGTAKDIALENLPVLGGVAIGLVGWTFRGPLTRFAHKTYSRWFG
jgi:hypothetical protein